MNHDLEKYILQHIDEEEEVLKELDRITNLKVLRPRMISGHIQGTLLKMICRMVNPQTVLEIGTFTGYSTISMVRGLSSKAHIHTIEINDELEDIIRTYFQKAGIEKQVSLHIGDALRMINEMDTTYDLVFIDGDKREYPAYFNAVLPKLKTGGFIIADNILWGGKVAQPDMPDDAYTKGIMEFNELVKKNASLEKTIIPIRDGITLIRKL